MDEKTHETREASYSPEGENSTHLARLSAVVMDSFLRIEALRLILQESGLVEPEKFEQRLLQMKQELATLLETKMVENLKSQNSELLKMLLQLHSDTKQ